MTDQVIAVAKSRLPKLATGALWFFVLAVCLASLILSGMAWQRSKLDNDTLKTISDITERLERTANRLDALSENSNAFNRQQGNYLHEDDQQRTGDYRALSEKFNIGDLGVDDGTTKWLFSQDNRVGSQQSSGDQKPGDSDQRVRNEDHHTEARSGGSGS